MTSKSEHKTTMPAQVDDANASVVAAVATMEDRARPRVMLNEAQVLKIVPVSYVTLWRMARAGLFPKPTYISPNRKVWFADEIIQWQNSINGRSRGRRPRRKS